MFAADVFRVSRAEDLGQFVWSSRPSGSLFSVDLTQGCGAREVSVFERATFNIHDITWFSLNIPQVPQTHTQGSTVVSRFQVLMFKILKEYLKKKLPLASKDQVIGNLPLRVLTSNIRSCVQISSTHSKSHGSSCTTYTPSAAGSGNERVTVVFWLPA